MFIAIFIICLTADGKQSCTANIGRTAPFYTKKECMLHTQSTYGNKAFKCIKLEEPKSN